MNAAAQNETNIRSFLKVVLIKKWNYPGVSLLSLPTNVLRKRGNVNQNRLEL
jgi:hypothetical protein